MWRSLLVLALVPACLNGQILDKQALLAKQSFWANKDFEWYKKNIPFFECPDEEINTTYYYRWELVTKHLTYGSPDTGYVFTEFANRPFWSGAYGAISCPSGHQINEVRWLKDPRYVRDFTRYWFKTPGAEPRKYSSWLAESTWAAHLVHPDKAFTTGLLPDLVKSYEEWSKRQWVAEKSLFWQSGHDDGMEYNINSRQSKDIVRGERGLRPSFNTYMWADAQSIARIADLAGDTKTAADYRTKADSLKKQVQTLLWDPKREFFFPMASRDETDAEGNVVKAFTLTYQSGKHAGDIHGREEHGYVPWAFNLPDPGFEAAWKFLMDGDYFKAPFGPTTVERYDPMFALKNTCCWWSGQSWPFATTQTLKGLANLLQNYDQKAVSRDDYNTLLHTYAISHRKNGKPYIAEGLNPDTGSWEGHDAQDHSENYFHSGFTDLIITGLVGIKPMDDENLVIDPLASSKWDYFALDEVPYRGHLLSILWDRDGSRYHKGKGLQIFVDGQAAAQSDELHKLTARLPEFDASKTPMPRPLLVNHAVNNDGNAFPRFSASFTAEGSATSKLGDGGYSYEVHPADRWTSAGSKSESDWVAVDFGMPRTASHVKLYVLDDGAGSGITAPASIDIETRTGTEWHPVITKDSPLPPRGGTPYVLSLPENPIEGIRATLHHSGMSRSGLTEFEAWGPSPLPYPLAPPSPGNLAFNPRGEGFPKASASFSDRFGGAPTKAFDGKVVFDPNPMNRWTSYESGKPTDWLELEFEKETKMGRVTLDIYDDKGGVQAPAAYTIETWQGDKWTEVAGQKKEPEKPLGGATNTVTFPQVSTKKVRVVFTNRGQAKSGVTEMGVFAE
ncbi:discoidin domain-containing protein [Haloferula sp. BvORR071]|uniref:discoidin domain-containing protein n=1 Tax=Haloferula sp. BvORR071 TaxID=1396141 RepID=UPI0006963C72|nr:discoidin domain-containing protein [Haloferula sp. BvORR071]